MVSSMHVDRARPIQFVVVYLMRSRSPILRVKVLSVLSRPISWPVWPARDEGLSCGASFTRQ